MKFCYRCTLFPLCWKQFAHIVSKCILLQTLEHHRHSVVQLFLRGKQGSYGTLPTSYRQVMTETRIMREPQNISKIGQLKCVRSTASLVQCWNFTM